MLISAVISILEDFGSLLPARTVTVKLKISKKNMSIFQNIFLDGHVVPRRHCTLVPNISYRFILQAC